MRHLIILVIFFIIACNNNESRPKQTSVDNSKIVDHSDTGKLKGNIWIDKLNGNKVFLPDTIANMPVSFYLNNLKISSLAKALYTNKFRPEDNDSTTQLLSFVTTDDREIRPFYRSCLDFTINISDGALSEYPGKPALKYATKFPQEFFLYMDKDTSGERYKQWTEIIGYSGLRDYTKSQAVIEKEIADKMFANCKSCTDNMKKRIKKFANDITKTINFQD